MSERGHGALGVAPDLDSRPHRARGEILQSSLGYELIVDSRVWAICWGRWIGEPCPNPPAPGLDRLFAMSWELPDPGSGGLILSCSFSLVSVMAILIRRQVVCAGFSSRS